MNNLKITAGDVLDFPKLPPPRRERLLHPPQELIDGTGILTKEEAWMVRGLIEAATHIIEDDRCSQDERESAEEVLKTMDERQARSDTAERMYKRRHLRLVESSIKVRAAGEQIDRAVDTLAGQDSALRQQLEQAAHSLLAEGYEEDEVVQELKQRREQMRLQKAPEVPGAELVDETKDQWIYRILTWEGCRRLGTKAWCIVRDESVWDDYTGAHGAEFFFHVDKKKGPPAIYAVAKKWNGGKAYTESYDANNDILLDPVPGVHDWHQEKQDSTDMGVDLYGKVKRAIAGDTQAMRELTSNRANAQAIHGLIEMGRLPNELKRKLVEAIQPHRAELGLRGFRDWVQVLAPGPAGDALLGVRMPRGGGIHITAFERLAGPERTKVLMAKFPQIAKYIEDVSKEDPTGGQQKYLDWAARMLQKEWARLNGPPNSPNDTMYAMQNRVRIIASLLKRWHAVQKYLGKGELKELSKDINSYKTYEDLEDPVSRAEVVARKIEADYDTVYEDDDWIAYECKNKAAVCELGTDSWCVARPDQTHYESYKGRDPKSRFVMLKNKKLEGEMWLAYVVGDTAEEIKDENDEDPTSRDVLPMQVFDKLKINVDDLEYADDEPEDPEVSIYYCIYADEVAYASTSERACKRWGDNDVYIRGSGYEVRGGTVLQSDWEENENTPRNLNIEGDYHVEDIEPETQEVYLLKDYNENDTLGQHYFDDETEARTWIEENPDTIAEEGFTLFKAEVAVDQYEEEDAKYWSFSNEEKVDEQEPGEEAQASASAPVEIYFSRAVLPSRREQTEFDREEESPVFSAVEVRDGIEALNRDTVGRQENIYKGVVSQREWNRIRRSGQFKELQPENVEKVKSIPAPTQSMYLIVENGKPTQCYDAIEYGGALAKHHFQEYVQTSPLSKVELVFAQIPVYKVKEYYVAFWLDGVKNAKVIETHEPQREGAHTVSMDERALDQLPVGTKIRGAYAPDDAPWHTRMEDGSWQVPGRGRRQSGQFFPFGGASLPFSVEFASGTPKSEPATEAPAGQTEAPGGHTEQEQTPMMNPERVHIGSIRVRA